ncbi:DUF4844 domain-containing protein [Caenimonas aquaedulcis]|uniref:DUF4844 domain-containing protein n=1 Tax=Caenimonas aquaedulcis TaxID=2793270 RepID=A0A931H7G4_9BURK|nr:DUF4844 domain-containing protein [Caenimonas aquaedulcis]MBG9390081.1 DUF4844 domain-containing protein [Caenimonas aquaedulcis]
MSNDPISLVVDEPLRVSSDVLEALAAFRESPKLELLPGVDTRAEKKRLVPLLDQLADRLLAGIAQNPSKLWVLKQFQVALIQLQNEDTEAREHFGMDLEHIMDILGIESSDGLLAYYLGGL